MFPTDSFLRGQVSQEFLDASYLDRGGWWDGRDEAVAVLSIIMHLSSAEDQEAQKVLGRWAPDVLGNLKECPSFFCLLPDCIFPISQSSHFSGNMYWQVETAQQQETWDHLVFKVFPQSLDLDVMPISVS